ncbi:MAG: DUF429 domain-containing protein [Pseudomonadota bacterium]
MIVGVDGCAAGWIAVAIVLNGAWTVDVYPNIETVWESHPQPNVILVDIPIGLSENGTRLCDQEARRMLGRRAVSVFSVPCRPAVYAGSYDEACDINKAHTGHRISKQTWAIVPKIREMDQFLQNNPQARAKVREVHPEVCFAGLNGLQPMAHRKKDAEGRRERMAVLERFYPRIGELVAEAQLRLVGRRTAGIDDVLDAATAAITGLGGRARLKTLPEVPPKDLMGLPMEMVYRVPD